MLDINFSRRQFEIFFLIFPENRLCHLGKLSPKKTFCMKSQSLFSGKKNRKNITSLSSAEFVTVEFAQSVEKLIGTSHCLSWQTLKASRYFI